MVVIVAGRVFSVGKVIFAAFHHLGATSGQITFALLGDDIGYHTSFCLEVVAHCLRLVFTALVGEYRRTLQFAYRVGTTYGIDYVGGHVHFYFSALQLHVAILYFAVAIHERAVFAYKHQ